MRKRFMDWIFESDLRTNILITLMFLVVFSFIGSIGILLALIAS